MHINARSIDYRKVREKNVIRVRDRLNKFNGNKCSKRVHVPMRRFFFFFTTLRDKFININLCAMPTLNIVLKFVCNMTLLSHTTRRNAI